ncbi:MAG: M24 family metallopeptidase, partial [Bacteroidia bacterium]|nr:M24 family metallopeptidase [Bacteroidia bacterium]
MFKKDTYIERRKALKNSNLRGIALVLGNVDSPMNYLANTFYFRQDSSFLYFFGLDFPGLAGVIDFDSGEEIIFGDDVDMEDIIWMGPQVSLQENAAKAGVVKTAPYKKLFDFAAGSIKKGRKIHFLPPYRAENKIILEKLLGISVQRIQDFASVELIKAIVNLRSVKEPAEIEEIRKACAIGYEMHVTAMKMAKPGIWEQKIAGTLEGIANSNGGMVSFPIILSQNGETLHNHDHSKYLKAGKLMLTDAGAETSLHYASDFTRTVPVGGKFTTKQREIYN